MCLEARNQWKSFHQSKEREDEAPWVLTLVNKTQDRLWVAQGWIFAMVGYVYRHSFKNPQIDGCSPRRWSQENWSSALEDCVASQMPLSCPSLTLFPFDLVFSSCRCLTWLAPQLGWSWWLAILPAYISHSTNTSSYEQKLSSFSVMTMRG